MALQNNWLSPLQRSYEQIKQGLITKLLSMKFKGQPLITDVTEGNILVLLTSMFAAVAEVIHYYIDNMYRESIFGTCRRLDSLVNHAELVDYHINGATPAFATVMITRSGASFPKLIIPTSAKFTDTSGNVWHPVKATVFPAGSTVVKVNLIQAESLILSGNYTPYKDSTGTWVIDIPSTIAGSSKINGLYSNVQLIGLGGTWSSVKTLAWAGPTDYNFLFRYNPLTKGYQIVFGNGTNGKLPDTTKNITSITLSTTNGAMGNVTAGAINYTDLSGNYSVNNESPAGGGNDGEDFYDLKRRVPLSVRTMGMAVTKQDIIDIALQYPGVSQATLDVDYNRKMILYISPINGGASNESLCQAVKEEILNNAPIASWLEVKPVKEVNLNLTMEVTGRESFRANSIKSEILNALQAAYPATGPIGGNVRLSDIYALIDNLPSVDYLVITQFYLHPVFKVLYGSHYPELNSFGINSVVGSNEYILEFTSATKFNIIPRSNQTIKGQTSSTNATTYHQFEGKVGEDVQVNWPEGTNFTINIKSGSFTANDRLSFIVSEPNHNYEATGFNIPVFNVNHLNLTINEVL